MIAALAHASCWLLVLLPVWPCAGGDAALAVQRGGIALHHDHDHGRGGNVVSDSDMAAVELDATMKALVDRLLKRHSHSPTQREMVEAGLRKISLKAAAKRLEGKLPVDVASLVHVVNIEGKSKSQQPFAEESLAKARKYLNEMVEKAWHELDDKLIECKEFEDKNRGTFEQVMTDIARLAEQIADLSVSRRRRLK